MFFAKTEKHSCAKDCGELYSVFVQFPRVVLAEVGTHRLNSDTWNDDIYCYERLTTKDMSKNSASSRAIPVSKFLEQIDKDPYIPQWTKNQGGMQGKFLDERSSKDATKVWLKARDVMVKCVSELSSLEVHKQDCNRLLEPWMWVTQLITATGSAWNNFFHLRCHSDPYPPFRTIARMIYLEKRKSVPMVLEENQWHLPFISNEESKDFYWCPEIYPYVEGRRIPDLIKTSVARCAWLSLCNHNKDASMDAINNTYERLVGSSPVHASPAEHQASPLYDASNDRLKSNLNGWLQFRKLLSKERVTEYKPTDEEVYSWGLL